MRTAIAAAAANSSTHSHPPTHHTQVLEKIDKLLQTGKKDGKGAKLSAAAKNAELAELSGRFYTIVSDTHTTHAHTHTHARTTHTTHHTPSSILGERFVNTSITISFALASQQTPTG